jgi:hypothetical protein
MPEQPSLAGPHARLDRADALINELNVATKAFAATRPYRAVQVDDPNPLNRRFVVEAVDEVPLDIRVRAGEVVHHTRAALDLLVYQLLLRAGVDDERRLRRCAFPIIRVHDPTDRQQAANYAARMTKAIDGVFDDARGRIEAVQPWRPENAGAWSHLSQVEELDNTQKHRLLLTGVIAFRMRHFVLNDNGVAKLIPEAFFAIEPGQMIIASGIAPGAAFDRNFADDVIFHESGPPSGWPLGHILRNLNAMTRETVDGFADCFDAPSARFPKSIERKG